MDTPKAPPIADAPTISISPLTPTDVDSLLPLHVEAFQGFIGVRLGNRYTRHVLGWFATKPSAIGFVARGDEGIRGYVFGAPVGYAARMNRDLLPWGVIALLARPHLLLDLRVLRQISSRLRLLLRLDSRTPSEPPIPAPTLSLVAVGTRPDSRRLGIGQALIETYCRAAKELGFASVRLSVHKDNRPAIQLYESLGWRPLPHQGNPSLICYALVLAGSDHARGKQGPAL